MSTLIRISPLEIAVVFFSSFVLFSLILLLSELATLIIMHVLFFSIRTISGFLCLDK